MRIPAPLQVALLLVVALAVANAADEPAPVNEHLILLVSDYCDWTGVICTGEADLDLFQHRNIQQAEENNGVRVMGLDLTNNFLQCRTPASVG